MFFIIYILSLFCPFYTLSYIYTWPLKHPLIILKTPIKNQPKLNRNRAKCSENWPKHTYNLGKKRMEK